MNDELQGKVAIVTGSAGGIGTHIWRWPSPATPASASARRWGRAASRRRDIDEMDGVRWARQRANLRSGPSTEHPVAGALAAGEEVTVKGRVRDSEWLLVATSEGGEAFVYAPLLDDRPPSASEPATPTPAPVRDTALEATFWESVKDGGRGRLQGVLGTVPRWHIRAAVRPRSEDERRRFD